MSARSLDVETLLEAPALAPEHKLHGILEASARRRVVAEPVTTAHWPAEHYGLEQVALFQAATADERARVLAGCAQALLREAYFIEKAGMAFAAKMVLLARTTEERMLYCHFAADEAAHLGMLQSYYPEPDPAPLADPFLALLAEVIETGGRPTLVALVQVVLEGWGLSHYRALGRRCATPGLRALLRRITADEGRHYASGVACAGDRAPDSERARLKTALGDLLRMVQLGPQSVVAALDRGLGGLSFSQRTQAFRELGCEAHSAARLALVRELVAQADASLVPELAERFVALGPEACAGAKP